METSLKSWPGDGDAPASQAGPMFAINRPIDSDKERGDHAKNKDGHMATERDMYVCVYIIYIYAFVYIYLSLSPSLSRSVFLNHRRCDRCQCNAREIVSGNDRWGRQQQSLTGSPDAELEKRTALMIQKLGNPQTAWCFHTHSV